MAVEKIFWSVRKTAEHTVGEVMFDMGNWLALSGHEKIAQPLIKRGAAMCMVAGIPHEPVRLDPAILNPDGTLNAGAFRKKLQWQADELQADEDIKTGKVQRFSTPEEAIHFLKELPFED